MGENDIRMMADAIWTYIRDKHLKEYLSDSVCYYRAEVVSAPSGGTMQVQRPFDQPVTLPYMGNASGLRVGSQCVVLVFGDPSNAIVIGDGALTSRQVVVTNTVEDGNFADTSYWGSYNATFTASGNVGTTQASAQFVQRPQLYRDNIATNAGHVYYLRGEMRYAWTSSTPPPERGGVKMVGSSDSGIVIASSVTSYPLDGSWYKISAYGAFNSSQGNINLLLPTRGGANQFGIQGLSVMWRNVMLVDLTEAFGTGEEPAQSVCDQKMPYFQRIALINF